MSIFLARSACFIPNFFLQYFSCWGGVSLNTTEPAIHVSSSPAVLFSILDKRETNSPTGDKKIFVIIDEHTRVAMTDKLRELNSRVTRCVLCPRLSQYIRQVGREKVKRFADEKYWARPLPSWGDPNARLLIVGLAPAAHGGNRTGRM